MVHPVNEYIFITNTVTVKVIMGPWGTLFKTGNLNLTMLVAAPILRNKSSSGQAQKA
ncbi:hypothetical protein ACFLZT_01700 [Thermodesulfobacteriota bacterium]